MAAVFLSYVREDAEKARALASLLEREGHSVWWDRRIKGGAQYSTEIETALKAADKIVVLWSAKSITSAWVRDEAAAGRDTGRLVPVTTDGTEPPLGFRQYQTIVLRRGRIRSGSAEMKALIEALDSPSAVHAGGPRGRDWGLRFRLPRAWLVAAAAVALIVIGGGWWWMSQASAHPPTVVVEGVNDQSREVARELTVRLSELQTAQADSFQLISGPGRADLRFQVNAADSPAVLRRDLTMLSGANGAILWSASLQQPSANADQLSQQVTLTSQRVLSCALEALSDRKDRIDPSTLKLYLGGCSRLQDVFGNDDYHPDIESLFEKVVANAPHFAGAWAKLLQSEAEPAAQADPPPALVAKLRKHVEAVEARGLDIGELYVAKAALLPTDDFLGKFALYDAGIKADPGNPLLYERRSNESLRVGRMNDSVADAGQAVHLDPLSPALAEQYASALAYAGQIEAGYDQLRKAEAKWPGAPNLRMARFRLDLRYGDSKEALDLYRNGYGAASIDPAMESFIEARIDPTPANVQKAIDSEKAEYAQEPRYIAGLLQVLGQFGRKDEAIDTMLHYTRPDATGYNADTFFRPAMREVWRDPRSIAGAAHLRLLGYWEKSGRWPDFCSDPTLPYNCKNEAAKYRV